MGNGLGIAGTRALLASLPADASVYIQGGAGESLAFRALLGESGAPPGLRLFSSLTPGLNDFDYSAALPDARLETILLPGALREGYRAGRITPWLTTYYGGAQRLARSRFDLVIAHAAVPEGGRTALGLTADFVPIIWAEARRRLLIVNPDMPVPRGAWTIPADLADAVLELPGPLPALALAGEDGAARAIAGHVTSLLRDGDILQIGIGRVPDCVLDALAPLRDLTLHSGAIGDGLIRLAESGALRPGRAHRVGAVVGSQALHRFVTEHDLLELPDTFATHDPRLFPALPRFISINSALQVDLMGQANLEWRGGQFHGGIGGAPDFILGARLSPGGRSILALPAGNRTRPRIVARLSGPAVSIGRHDTDTIVTEHGIAAIAGLEGNARAEALIAVAAPEHRDALTDAWDAMRRAF